MPSRDEAAGPGVREDGVVIAARRRRGPVGAAAAVALAAAIAVVVLLQAWGEDDFWAVAVPGVHTGCGTLALAAVTFAVLVGDQSDRRKREAQDVRRADQERRAQASRVQVGEASSGGGQASTDYTDMSYTSDVHNHSADTVGEVTVMFVVRPTDARSDFAKMPVNPLGRLTADQRKPARVEVRMRAVRGTPVAHEIDVWTTFRDAAGVLWARDPSHRLIEIDEAQARLLRFHADKGMPTDSGTTQTWTTRPTSSKPPTRPLTDRPAQRRPRSASTGKWRRGTGRRR